MEQADVDSMYIVSQLTLFLKLFGAYFIVFFVYHRFNVGANLNVGQNTNPKPSLLQKIRGKVVTGDEDGLILQQDFGEELVCHPISLSYEEHDATTNCQYEPLRDSKWVLLLVFISVAVTFIYLIIPYVISKNMPVY